jgi:hypothetical protein
MKPLNLKETALKEEMKERCLAKGQYIDENAKAKFEMLCHLEDFEVQYWELQQQNKQQSEKIGKLEDNWNKLREWIIYNKHNENTEQHYLVVDYGTLLGKMQELEQGSDSDE